MPRWFTFDPDSEPARVLKRLFQLCRDCADCSVNKATHVVRAGQLTQPVEWVRRTAFHERVSTTPARRWNAEPRSRYADRRSSQLS